jgi:hypothetical protein
MVSAMTDTDQNQDKEFEKTVKNLLKTPPKPHKPKENMEAVANDHSGDPNDPHRPTVIRYKGDSI